MRAITFWIITLLLTIIEMPAIAQSIKIKVIDVQLEQPVNNVLVVSEDNEKIHATTNINGETELSIFKEATNVQIIAHGYEKQVVSLFQSDVIIYLSPLNNTLHDVVITGVTTPVKRTDALANYSVINANTIKAMGAVTLDQALQYQQNTRFSNDGVLGSSMRMQAMGGDKVKILYDGLPVNGRENGNVDLGQINLYNTERVEVVQGPMSVVYGTDALGGVINVISKRPKKGTHIGLTSQYETLGKYNLHVNGSTSFKKKHAIALGAGRNYFDGYKYLDTGEIKRFTLFKPKEQYLANATYTYYAHSGFRLQYFTDFLKEKVINKGTANITPYSAFALDDHYDTWRFNNRLLLSGKLNPNLNWQLSNSYMLYNRHRNLKVKNLETLEETLALGTGNFDTATFQDVNLRGSLHHKLEKWSYSFGYDVNLQFATSRKISTGPKDIQDYAGFLTIQLPIVKDNLIIEGGARAAYNSVYNSPIIPSVSLMAKPVKNVQIRGSYAKGFRAASLKEMYLNFVDAQHDVIGNANLQPEFGDHFQLSGAWQMWESGQQYVQLSAIQYYNNIYNSIQLIPMDPLDTNSIKYTYANVDRMQNAITNAQLEAQVKNFYVSLGWSYTYIINHDKEQGDFKYHGLIVNSNYFWTKPKVRASLFYRLYASQPFIVTDISGGASYGGEQPGYSIMDFTLSRNFFNSKLGFTAGVKNLFNVSTITARNTISTGGVHSSGGSLNMLPRSLFVRVDLNFKDMIK